MAGFRVTVNSAQVRHLLSQLSAKMEIQVIKRSLDITTKDVEADIKDRMSGRTIAVRSGTYRRSVHAVPASMKNGRMQASVESEVKERKGFEHLLEHGGTVRPKSRRVLTIPLPGALTAAGKRRFDAPTALRNGAFFVSSFASLTKGGFQQNRLSGGLIAMSKGKRLIPLFALKGSATIGAHPIWGPVAESSRLLAVLTLERTLNQVIAQLEASAGPKG